MKRFFIPLLALSVSMGAAEANEVNYTLTLEQKRLIAAMLTAPKSSPGSAVTIPSGFGAGQGQAFASIGGTRTNDEFDGSAGFGFGLGNASETVAVELSANIISLTDNGNGSGFAEQGSTSIKLSRMVTPTSSVSIGAENATTWGITGTDPNFYIAYSHIQTLSSDPFNPMPLSLTIGAGNERFTEMSNGKRSDGLGVFAGVSLAFHRQAGAILDYNGNYMNFGLSLVPLPQYPVSLTLSMTNINSVDPKDGGSASGDPEFGAGLGYSWSF